MRYLAKIRAGLVTGLLVCCSCWREGAPEHNDELLKLFSEHLQLGMRLSEVQHRVPGLAFSRYSGYKAGGALPFGFNERTFTFDEFGDEFPSAPDAPLRAIHWFADSIPAEPILRKVVRTIGEPDRIGCTGGRANVYIWTGRRRGVFVTVLPRTAALSHVHLAYHDGQWRNNRVYSFTDGFCRQT